MIFTQQLKKIDPHNVPDALKAMAQHIQYIQEQLEYTLMNLDSSNINEINTNETVIGSGAGSQIAGDSITFRGTNGEVFEAGVRKGSFVFSVKGKGGVQMMYLTSGGKLVLTNNAALHIDGGTW